MVEPRVFRRVFLQVVFFTWIVDAITKYAAWVYLKDQPPVGFGFIEFTFTLNRGNMFGVLIGSPELGLLTKLLMYLFIGWFAKLMIREFADRRTGVFYAGLIVGGAVGNVGDTLTYGGTPDMIHLLHCGPLSKWVFNIADIAVFVGAGRFFWECARKSRSTEQ